MWVEKPPGSGNWVKKAKVGQEEPQPLESLPPSVQDLIKAKNKQVSANEAAKKKTAGQFAKMEENKKRN